MSSETCDVLVVGGGPAGLRAAEIVSAHGLRTVLADRMRSVGRKFLVAGRGGLNLTHAEPLETFVTRYDGPARRWEELLADFSPDDLRAWAQELGIQTFIGTSRRVFPTDKHAAPLLRRWVERLRRQGVSFQRQHRLISLRPHGPRHWEVELEHPEGRAQWQARTVILALGGASWPQTGSDGSWTRLFDDAGILVTPLAPANCGYEIDWPAPFLAEAEGLPLKNIVVTAGPQSVAGELLITKYGVEGGALYQLGRTLRESSPRQILLDLKPAFTLDQLLAKFGHTKKASLDHATQAWRLSPVAENLLRLRQPFASPRDLALLTKAFPLLLRQPRPLAEAISTAGGVPWKCLNKNLMVKAWPGVFCAGEMIDWEAPTGGYLLQGCLATGTRAARGALEFFTPGD
jgi:uncharacterized flavoprotein (TIGR03862 family)